MFVVGSVERTGKCNTCLLRCFCLWVLGVVCVCVWIRGGVKLEIQGGMDSDLVDFAGKGKKKVG